jgi:multimeric flavodoxin WrbA
MKKREFIKSAALTCAGLAAGYASGRFTKSDMSKKGKKIIAVNGSPHADGNMAFALHVMNEIFEAEGVDFEIINIGQSNIRGCIACRVCRNKKIDCVHVTSEEKQWIDTMKTADAIILASPTFFGGIAGTMKSFLDKAFCGSSNSFSHKIGAAVVTTPRTGASMTFEGLNQYFTISQMTIASSTYWNNIRGFTVDDLKQDAEGIRILQNLAKNIIKLL